MEILKLSFAILSLGCYDKHQKHDWEIHRKCNKKFNAKFNTKFNRETKKWNTGIFMIEIRNRRVAQ